MASIIGSIFRTSSLFGAAKSLVTEGGNSSIGDVVIDAVLSEVINYNSNVTQHPVETKTSISDHIFKQPLKVKIEGYITNSPIKIMGLFETPLQKNSLSNLKRNIKDAMPFYAAECPAMQGYAALKSLYEDRSLVSVVTKLETFSNMAITSLNFTNNTDTGGRLEFTAELIQVTYARIETTQAITRNNTALARLTAGSLDKGNTPKQSEVIKPSWAAQIFDSF